MVYLFNFQNDLFSIVFLKRKCDFVYLCMLHVNLMMKLLIFFKFARRAIDISYAAVCIFSVMQCTSQEFVQTASAQVSNDNCFTLAIVPDVVHASIRLTCIKHIFF